MQLARSQKSIKGLGMRKFIENVNELEPIELRSLHPRHHATLTALDCWNPKSSGFERSRIVELLLKRLTSISDQMTVQQRVMIGLLFANHAEAGAAEIVAAPDLYVDKTELDAVGTLPLSLALSDHSYSYFRQEIVRTTLQFIFSLPAIIDVAPNLKADSKRKLYSFLSDLLALHGCRLWGGERRRIVCNTEHTIHSHILSTLVLCPNHLSSELESLPKEEKDRNSIECSFISTCLPIKFRISG